MHLKNSNNTITSKWTSLFSKGADIAKGGLQFVNKQIEDIKISINDINDVSGVESFHYLSEKDDLFSHSIESGKIPIYYQYQTSNCPSQCSVYMQCSHSSASTPSSHTSFLNKQSGITNLQNSVDKNVFFWLPDIPMNELTLGHLKNNFPPILLSNFNSSQFFQIFRFKIKPPSSDLDMFGDYVWLDCLSDHSLVPIFNGAIHMKICLFSIPIEDTLTNTTPLSLILCSKNKNDSLDQSTYTSLPSHLSQPNNTHISNFSSLYPIDRDLLSNTSHSNSSSTDYFADNKLPHVQQHTCLPLNRIQLQTKREANQEARIQYVLEQHYERRHQESTKAEEIHQATESLKSYLDQWAFNSDSTLKDPRTLISTLSEVLWEGSQYEPISLSDLLVMSPTNLKKVYRTTLLSCHPDKHQNSPADIQYRAHRIFQALNESFRLFKQHESG